MKIAHIINYYHEGFSYQENWLAKWQHRLGHDVLVVSSDYYFPFPHYVQSMRPRLGDRHVGAGRFSDGDVKLLRKKSYLAHLGRPGMIFFPARDVLNDFHPDAVHVHGATNMCLPEIMLLQRRLGYKIFVDSHQDEVVANNDATLVGRAYYGLWRFFYHRLGMKKRVSRFLPITEGAKNWLKSHLHLEESNMTLSPLGVDLQSMFYDKASEDEFRRAYGIGDRLLIVNAGKQYPKKRIEWVIDVFQAALDQGADAFLVLAGNSDEQYDKLLRNKLRLAEGRYLRLPLLSAEKLRQLYCAADVGIWPGVPSATIQEALACGVAVILPDNDIVGHLVDGNGLRESEDISRAAAFVRELSADGERLRILKNRSIAIANKYDWKSIASDLVSIYAK